MSIPSSPTLKDVQAFDPFEREADVVRDQLSFSNSIH
jgi:hypothetical protein